MADTSNGNINCAPTNKIYNIFYFKSGILKQKGVSFDIVVLVNVGAVEKIIVENNIKQPIILYKNLFHTNDLLSKFNIFLRSRRVAKR